MKLSQVKQILSTIENVSFQLENGEMVPNHFHITEVGAITKKFIDCGGTVRNENVVNFQLWNANDTDHQLAPQKLLSIIELSEKVLGIEDHEVEVEYQNTSISKFDLDFDGEHFLLKNKFTACLAQDQCGIPTEKQKIRLSEITKPTNACTPGGGCC